MPNARPEPTVRRRRLGEELRRIRNHAGPDGKTLTLELVVERLIERDLKAGKVKSSWKTSKLSRIENAQAKIRPAEVSDVLAVLGVKDQEVHTALKGLAQDADKRGWWQTYTGVVSPSYADYISLESDAESIRVWAPGVIPGLLQTAAVARETIAANAPARTPEEVTALAEVRMARQAVLSRPERPLKLWVVIHQAVLEQRFGVRHAAAKQERPVVMRDQLQRLQDAAELPNVTLQIMPSNSTPHPGGSGGFSLVGFPGPLPDVVLLENLLGASYVEAVDGVKTYADAFERIVAAALGTDDSLALIADLKEGTRKP